jgi:hypothetical protein
MLSFTKGIPIAYINGGEFNGKIICLDKDGKSIEELMEEEDEKQNIRELRSRNPLNDIGHDEVKRKYKKITKEKPDYPKKLNAVNLVLLNKCLRENINPDSGELKELYNECKEEVDNMIGKELKLIDEGKFCPIPYGGRINTLVAGPEDAGKTYYTVIEATQFLKLNPKSKIFLFTNQRENTKRVNPLESLRNYITRIPINDELKEFKINQLIGNLTIFDDVDTISDKKLKTCIETLIKRIINDGRQDDMNIISTTHILFGGNDTKSQIKGCRRVVFFPQCGSQEHIRRYLDKHCGIRKKEMVEKICKLDRWVSHSNRAPQYIMNEKYICLIK